MTSKYLIFMISLLIVLAETSICFNSVLLPNLKGDFLVSHTLMQMTVAVSLFALGFAGILYGGITDSLGRKKLILFGVFLFSLGAFLGAFATEIEWLFVGRILQGAGAGVAWIIGNASIKDSFEGSDYIVAMNRLHIVAGAIPSVAPVIGSYIAQIFGWRVCFALLGFLGVCVFFFLNFKLKETFFDQKPLSLSLFVNKYKSIFSDSKTVLLILIKIIFVSQLFADSANLPLICIQSFSMSPLLYSVFIGVAFFAYMSGSVVSEKFCSKYGVVNLIYAGILLSIIGQLLLGVFEFSMGASIYLLLLALKLTNYFSFGLIFGNTTALIASTAKSGAGAAAAVMISAEMLMSGLVIYVLSFFFNGTLMPISIYGILSGLCAVFFLKNHNLMFKMN